VVIAESTTGDAARDARVDRVLNVLDIVPADEGIARRAGALRHATRARRGGTIDAIVVATADRVTGSLVLTGDAGDLRHLAAVGGTTLVVSLT
jgi:predicted nucleic acid-binding protein